MSNRRVVVTGMGIVCPVGNSVKDAWDNIKAGHSGIGLAEGFDTTDFASRIAGQVKNFDPAAGNRRKCCFAHSKKHSAYDQNHYSYQPGYSGTIIHIVSFLQSNYK